MSKNLFIRRVKSQLFEFSSGHSLDLNENFVTTIFVVRHNDFINEQSDGSHVECTNFQMKMKAGDI